MTAIKPKPTAPGDADSAAPTPRVRLVSKAGVRAGVGEVELYAYGTWGVARGLSAAAAKVVCRELGYDSGAVAAGHMFRPPTTKYRTFVAGDCKGSEDSLAGCNGAYGMGWDNDDPTDSGMTVACVSSEGEGVGA